MILAIILSGLHIPKSWLDSVQKELQLKEEAQRLIIQREDEHINKDEET